MNLRLDSMVQAVINGQDTSFIGVLSVSEHCFVALASHRYDLLPGLFDDPIEAWARLDGPLRRMVCEWRGWPDSYAQVGA